MITYILAGLLVALIITFFLYYSFSVKEDKKLRKENLDLEVKCLELEHKLLNIQIINNELRIEVEYYKSIQATKVVSKTRKKKENNV